MDRPDPQADERKFMEDINKGFSYKEAAKMMKARRRAARHERTLMEKGNLTWDDLPKSWVHPKERTLRPGGASKPQKSCSQPAHGRTSWYDPFQSWNNRGREELATEELPQLNPNIKKEGPLPVRTPSRHINRGEELLQLSSRRRLPPIQPKGATSATVSSTSKPTKATMTGFYESMWRLRSRRPVYRICTGVTWAFTSSSSSAVGKVFSVLQGG